jgi:hypothetical protein
MFKEYSMTQYSMLRRKDPLPFPCLRGEKGELKITGHQRIRIDTDDKIFTIVTCQKIA